MRFLIILMAITLGGCASSDLPTEAEEQRANTAAKVRCTREVPTGSHRTITRCRTQAQVDAERAAAKDAIRRTETVRVGGGTP